MKRHGTLSSSMIFGLVGALLFGGLTLGVIEGMAEESLSPLADRSESLIEEEGGIGDVVIGEPVEEEGLNNNLDDSELAQQQMEALIVWNMMAASNCNILTTLHSGSLTVDEDNAGGDGFGNLDPEAKPFWYGEMHRDFLMTFLSVEDEGQRIPVHGTEVGEQVSAEDELWEEIAEETADGNFDNVFSPSINELEEEYDGENRFRPYHVSPGDVDEGFYDWDGQEYRPLMMRFNDESQGSRNAYIGRFGSFLPLTNSSYDARCEGSPNYIDRIAEDVSETIVDEAEENVQGRVEGFVSTLTNVASAGTHIVVQSCERTIDVGCTQVGGALNPIYFSMNELGGSEAIGNYVAGTIVPDAYDVNLASETGFDMEGRQGRETFKINETFKLGEASDFAGTTSTDSEQVMESLNKPLLGLSFNLNSTYVDRTPGFWRSSRLSYILPAGLEPPEAEKKYMRIHPGEYTVGEHFTEDMPEHKAGLGTTEEHQAEHWFYAYRPRMVNAPIIANDRFEDGDLITGEETGDHPVVQLRNFLANTQYLMCEGASGIIQSNAGHMENDGEASSPVGTVEDQVYPEIEVTQAESCIATDTTANILEDQSFDGLSCSRRQDIASDSSVVLFERETEDGDTKSAGVTCGADDQTVQIGGYGEQEVLYPQKAMRGCDADWYDLTEHGDNEQFVQDGLFDWITGSEDGISLQGEDRWSYQPEVLDQQADIDHRGTNSLETERIEMAFENEGDVQAFELDLQMDGDIPGSSQDEHNLWIVRAGNEFHMKSNSGFERGQTQTTITSNSDIQGFNTVEIDAEESRLSFNRPREEEGNSQVFADQGYGEIVDLEITPLDSSEATDVVNDLEAEENLGELRIGHILEYGEPEICR